MRFSQIQWAQFDAVASDAYFDMLYQELVAEYGALPEFDAIFMRCRAGYPVFDLVHEATIRALFRLSLMAGEPLTDAPGFHQLLREYHWRGYPADEVILSLEAKADREKAVA
ncbi:MAG: hypothetical protein ACRC6I_15000 [Paracoccaceae bacterium]